MEWIEVAARSIEEARELALDRLGVIEDELEYEVIQEPSKGIFGIGRSEARIRARVRPLSREKPNDRRRRRERGPAGRGRQERPGRRRPRGDEAGTTGSPEPARTGGGGGRRRTRSSRPPARAAKTTEEDVVTVELSIEEQADTARAFAAGLVDAFGVRATVGSTIDEDVIEVSIDGDGLGLMVGPKGVTLAALEELVRAVVAHATGGHSARVHVDVGGYRRRRREALAAFATSIAREVVASGEARALEPMNAADRKVVHDTVALLDGLATESEGEEPRRRVVIRPA